MRTILIAALLGLSSAYEYIGHKKRLAILNNLIQMDESDSDSDEDQENVQISKKEWEYEEVPAVFSGSPAGNGYERAIPARFAEERDDRLMHSLLKNYAREIKVNGKLTGQFFLNKEDAKAAYDEIVKSHPNYATGADFDGAWEHFDVNKDGLVEVDRMPQFFRYAMPGGAKDIDLQ